LAGPQHSGDLLSGQLQFLSSLDPGLGLQRRAEGSHDSGDDDPTDDAEDDEDDEQFDQGEPCVVLVPCRAIIGASAVVGIGEGHGR
jgi:hypothetical protein